MLFVFVLPPVFYILVHVYRACKRPSNGEKVKVHTNRSSALPQKALLFLVSSPAFNSITSITLHHHVTHLYHFCLGANSS